MKVLHLAVLALLAALPLLRAQNVDLANAISANFTVSAGPPVTMQPSSGTFRAKAKAVHDYMLSLSYTGSPAVTTVVSGVDIMWGTGTVSWSQNEAIVLATSAAANDASATVSGDESSAYAVVIEQTLTVSNAGDAYATDSGALGGEARAYGGLGVRSTTVHGGDATASSVDGTAYAEAGYGKHSGGNGGAASATGGTGADAIGGEAKHAGNGGSASAISGGGNVNAYGGNTNGGNGGYAYSDADGYSYAWGGDTSSPGDGGNADAYSQNAYARAEGGLTNGSGDGGDAYAESLNSSFPYSLGAVAVGGNTVRGEGGGAEAWSYNEAEAYGGSATSEDDDFSFGGAAEAISINESARAYGGDGNNTQLAYAQSLYGDAYALGGNGIGDGAAIYPINGGDAQAVAPNGVAEARGGDCLTTNLSGWGGIASADGQSPGAVVDDPTGISTSGGYAYQN
jgi:hypothetical protein